MLRLLNIHNIALIDRLQIELKPGLNVLSGETGSGKSIILDALMLLLGERAPQEIIRSGEERAYVEGVFEIEGNAPLLQVLDEAGIEVGGTELIVKREVSTAGRGRVFVNNQLATLGLLKGMQPHLVDLHGQGDQQSLLSSDVHLNLFDAFAAASKQRARVAQIYEGLTRILKELEKSRQSESERLQALDILGFQITEIEHAVLCPGEDAELDSERNLLVNAEKLAKSSSEVYLALQEDESSILTRLGVVQKRVRDLAGLDARFAPYQDQLSTVKEVLDDLAFFIGDYIAGIQASPERLNQVDDRLAEIERLKRKYGSTIEEILSVASTLADKRDHFLNSEAHLKSLETELVAALEEYRAEAAKLSKLRKGSRKNFETKVCEEFADVSLGAATFAVRMDDTSLSATAEKIREFLANAETSGVRRSGNETIEFYFTANEGEEPRPLRAVASGGELSRLMLVLKTIIAPSLIPKTLVFDEIDAGIGGKVADSVGIRLKRLAETNQVLCVTHQVQLARHAAAHFLVDKHSVDGRAITRVVELDKQGRIDELARMIGGSEITPLARKHAQELLRTSSGKSAS